MREARHIDKDFFCLTSRLFYEPFDVGYRPDDELRAIVDRLIERVGRDARVERDGLWSHVIDLEATPAPDQGWKIHVSATPANASEILRRTAGALLARRTQFKYLVDTYALEFMTSKRAPRGASGKFITVYPSDMEDFRDLLELLYAKLQGCEGPAVLSDLPYKDSSVVHYRYGGISARFRMDVRGVGDPVIEDPSGELVEDPRHPYFVLPRWVVDPFAADVSPADDEIPSVGPECYAVETALHFSNMGGVYRARHPQTGQCVVLKEARPHTCVSEPLPGGGLELLRREALFLERLADVAAYPRVRDVFEEGGHVFIAMDHIEGQDLRVFLLEKSPLLAKDPSREASQRYFDDWCSIIAELADGVEAAHERGIVLGDLSPANVLLSDVPPRVRIFDVEAASAEDVPSPLLFTPAFRREERLFDREQTPADDAHSVALIATYAIFPITSLALLRRDYLDGPMWAGIFGDLGWPKEALDAVRALADGRCSLTEFRKELAGVAEIAEPSIRALVDDVAVARRVDELRDFLLTTIERDQATHRLVPCDPYGSVTNPLSFGFGGLGILHALRSVGADIPERGQTFLHRCAQNLDAIELPPGLLTGLSGMALALWDLGDEDAARRAMDLAIDHRLASEDLSLGYGVAGIGAAALQMYRLTREDRYLAAAVHAGDVLGGRARSTDDGVYWPSGAGSASEIYLGLAYGSAGIGTFLDALADETSDDKFAQLVFSAMRYELSHGVEVDGGALSFPGEVGTETIEPYVEAGSGGVLKAMVRSGWTDRRDAVAADVSRKYSVFAGYLYGLAGLADALLDAELFTGDRKYRAMAKLPIAGLELMYMIETDLGTAVPGDNLLRVSCDYGTGVAGVLRVLDRYAHGGEPDLLLAGRLHGSKVVSHV